MQDNEYQYAVLQDNGRSPISVALAMERMGYNARACDTALPQTWAALARDLTGIMPTSIVVWGYDRDDVGDRTLMGAPLPLTLAGARIIKAMDPWTRRLQGVA